jgi:peptidoglycan/xylan/chitin deacetylase (PgdA/CDA1 family)
LLITAALDSDYYNVGSLVKSIFHGSASESIVLASNKLPNVATRHTGPIEFWRGSTAIHEMALTFDDGPSPTQTPKLLDALKQANVVGTFFVVGIRASAATGIITRMVADGHEVENHTYTHPNLDEVIPEHIREEYLRNAVVINTLTGRWPRFLRPPGGNSNPQVMQVAMECGMVGGFWTLDALNAEDTGSGANVSDYVVGHAKNGAIVLMHNGTQATIDAIPSMVAGLRAKGFRLVTLAQLAHDDGINVR